MAKLTQAQINTLNYLKAQLEASKENPAKCADGSYNFMGYSPYISVGGSMSHKATVKVLNRLGMVNVSMECGCLTVVAINNKGLEAIS